ncbi:MAG TPA: hypothetical protein VE401_09625 [Solirubrobacterales bacterium]|jgi:hypothetical protein|nr:hypothetical protein [Solirubrobacterales bacterium]
MYDFNRDHQEGNGFHGDGVTRRYLDAPFRRSKGVPSGIIEHDGSIYYADTGTGAVRRLHPDAGRREVLVGPWHPGAPSHHKHGTGITDWSDAAHGPADGDDPAAIDRWIATAGDQRLIAAAGSRWIKPMETLGEYSYVRDARGARITRAARSSDPRAWPPTRTIYTSPTMPLDESTPSNGTACAPARCWRPGARDSAASRSTRPTRAGSTSPTPPETASTAYRLIDARRASQARGRGG